MKKLILIILGIFLISFASALIVTSMDNIYIESNDPEIGGQTWVATMIGGIGVQEIIGDIDASNIESDGRIAEHDLRIKETVNRNRCEYSFSEEPNKYIYKISLIPGMAGESYLIYKFVWGVGLVNQLDEKKELCRNTPDAYYMTWKPEGIASFRFYCWRNTVDAKKGNLIFDGYRTEVDMSISAKGVIKTGTLNNYDTLSKTIGSGDYQAHLRWVGSLVSGENCETPPEQSITGAYKNGVWKTIDEDYYDDYRTYHSTGFKLCISNWLSEYGESPTTCMNKHNAKSDLATRTKTFYTTDGIPAIVSGTKAIINLRKAIQFPKLVMRIKAAWLGIRIPTAEPEIVSLTTEDFTVGEYGTIKVGVKNKDNDYDGEFAVSVSCPTIFETVGSVPTVRLNPLETKIVNVLVKNIRDIEEKDCEICKVVVYNTEKPTVKAESGLQVCINPLLICIKDDTRCVDKKFEYCYKGIKWNPNPAKDSECVFDECANDAECPSSKPFCVNKICAVCKRDRDCPSEFPMCENGACVKREAKWDNLYFLPILLTLGLAGLFGWRGKSRTGKYSVLDFLIGGVLGLGAGFALFWIIRNLLTILFVGFALGTTGLIIILIAGGIPLLLTIINMLFRRK